MFFFNQLHVPSIRWSCDSIPKHGVYRSGWTMVMSRDVFLQDFARLLNGYFYASHQMNQKKGTSLYSIMSTFRTHSIEIQNLRTFHFKWDFHPPPQKKNKTNTANTHWTHPKPACFLHFAVESSSSASRLFEGSTLVMKAINANVRSVFCSRDLWFFWLASASGVRSALKNRRTHFFGSKCFCWVFWVKSPGDWRTWSIWMHMDKSGNNW